MSRFRFSLASMMGAVVVVALTFAALRSYSEIWSQSFFTLTTCVLLLAIPAAVYGREGSRAFGLGFALVGIGHWLLGWAPGMTNEMQNRLITASITDYLQPKLQRQQQAPAGPGASMGLGGAPAGSGGAGGGARGGAGGLGGQGGSPGMAGGAGGQSAGGSFSVFGTPGGKAITLIVGPSRNQVWRILHSLLTLLFATAGGVLTRIIYLKNSTSRTVAP